MCDIGFHFICRWCSYGRRGFFLDVFPYDTDVADGTSGVHKRQSQAVSCLNCGTFIPCDTTSSNRLDLNSNVPPTRFLPWDYFGGLWHHLGTFHNVMGSLEASFKLVIRLPKLHFDSHRASSGRMGNFKFALTSTFSGFNPAQLIASSSMQIQLQLAPLPPPTICN